MPPPISFRPPRISPLRIFPPPPIIPLLTVIIPEAVPFILDQAALPIALTPSIPLSTEPLTRDIGLEFHTLTAALFILVSIFPSIIYSYGVRLVPCFLLYSSVNRFASACLSRRSSKFILKLSSKSIADVMIVLLSNTRPIKNVSVNV